jgi:hypothetical protein
VLEQAQVGCGRLAPPRKLDLRVELADNTNFVAIGNVGAYHDREGVSLALFVYERENSDCTACSRFDA